MATGPGEGTGGSLAIDYSTDPPTYLVLGTTVWLGTYCTGLQGGAGGLWVGDPATTHAIGGTLSSSLDPTTRKQKLTIGGSATGVAGSTSWSFTKD
jgi:hypothetical protein